MLLPLAQIKTFLSSYGLAFELELRKGFSVFKSAVGGHFCMVQVLWCHERHINFAFVKG